MVYHRSIAQHRTVKNFEKLSYSMQKVTFMASCCLTSSLRIKHDCIIWYHILLSKHRCLEHSCYTSTHPRNGIIMIVALLNIFRPISTYSISNISIRLNNCCHRELTTTSTNIIKETSECSSGICYHFSGLLGILKFNLRTQYSHRYNFMLLKFASARKYDYVVYHSIAQ